MLIAGIAVKLYIVVFLVTGGLCLFRLGPKKRAASVVLFALAMAFLVLTMDAPKDWGDLGHHFWAMDQIKKHHYTLWDLMKPEVAEAVSGRTYQVLLTFNALYCLVANLTDNYYFLPALCVTVDIVILGYIMLDWTAEHRQSWPVRVLSLLMCFAMVPYIHMLSGMRNAMAACICGLGLYRYLYKKKSAVWYIAAVAVAATVHPSLLMTVPFVILARIDLGWYGVLLGPLCTVGLRCAAKIMIRFDVEPFHSLAAQYAAYISGVQYLGSRLVLWGVIVLLVCVMGTYFFRVRENKLFLPGTGYRRIGNFIGYYGAFILSNLGRHDLVLRPAYVLGVLAPVLASLLTEGQIEPEGARLADRFRFPSRFLLLASVLCLAAGACVNLRFAAYYSPFFF